MVYRVEITAFRRYVHTYVTLIVSTMVTCYTRLQKYMRVAI